MNKGSALDCVVFGRLSGANAAKYMLGADAKPTDLLVISGGGLTGEVKSSKMAGGSYEDNMNKGAAGGEAKAVAAEAKDDGAAKKKKAAAEDEYVYKELPSLGERWKNSVSGNAGKKSWAFGIYIAANGLFAYAAIHSR